MRSLGAVLLLFFLVFGALPLRSEVVVVLPGIVVHHPHHRRHWHRHWHHHVHHLVVVAP